MISFAIVKTLFSGKLGHLVLWTLPIFTGIVITEAFLGQMIGALIAATPPTIAIIMLSRKQSDERAAGQAAVLKGQKELREDFDGKFTELRKAETGQAKAEGIIEGGDKERASAASSTAHDSEAVQKMEIVSSDENPITTRPAEPKK